MDKEHELKTWPRFFEDVASGAKTFEYRKNDRDFKLAEYLILQEWSSESGYTGREIRVQISKIWTADDIPGLPEDYVIMYIFEMSRKGFNEKDT